MELSEKDKSITVEEFAEVRGSPNFSDFLFFFLSYSYLVLVMSPDSVWYQGVTGKLLCTSLVVKGCSIFCQGREQRLFHVPTSFTCSGIFSKYMCD
jgi:hypothetical protein